MIEPYHLLRLLLRPAPVVVLLGSALSGCTSSWQAPLETRGESARRQPATPALRQAASYQVRPGDTLYGIAWNAGTDWRTLAAWNGLAYPYVIRAGQTLRLTPPPAVAAPPRPSTSRPKTGPAAPPPVAAPSPATSSKPVSSAAVSPRATPPAAAGPLRWSWPTPGELVSRFSSDDPARKGVKIAGREGQGIAAAEGGKVVYSGSGLIGYGRLIIIKHNDKYLSAYGHNRKLLVKEGDQVTKGERIAEMGMSNSGRAMLHFEIRREGMPVDPLQLLPRR